MRIIKDFINKFFKNSSEDQPWLSYYNKDDNTIKITDKCIYEYMVECVGQDTDLIALIILDTE